MRAFLCAVMFALCAPAWAGVVYNWETISISDDWDYMSLQPPVTGRLEVDSSAWSMGGGLYYSYSPMELFYSRCEDACNSSLSADPNSPILSLVFGAGQDSIFPLNLRPREGVGSFPAYTSTFALSFGSLLGGSIKAWDGNATLYASSSDGIWSIYGYGNDAGSSCYPNGRGYVESGATCATGRWVLDVSTIAEVPTPGTLALLVAPLLFVTARTARSAKRARTASRALTR